MPVLKSSLLARFLVNARAYLTRYSPVNDLTILLYRKFRILAIAILNFTFNPRAYFSPLVLKNVQPKFPCVENPLVSVILPTYNHGDYIKGAVESILDQDFRNFELILINDGSTDATSEIIQEYRKDSRVRIIEQDNQGLPKSLNTGFSLATGDFYTWTSADNLLSKNAISDLVKAANQETHSGLFYSDFQAIGENGFPLEPDNLWRIYDRDKRNKSVVRVKRNGKFFREVPSNFVGPYFLYRASLGKMLKHYSHTPGIEDWDFWLRMQFLTSFEYVPTSGLNYQYRVHQNSMSGNLDIEENFVATLELSLKITKKRLSAPDLSAKIDPLISEALFARIYKDRVKGIR
jgi:glycosyltransferase involved in cell wall biosynthesis